MTRDYTTSRDSRTAQIQQKPNSGAILHHSVLAMGGCLPPVVGKRRHNSFLYFALFAPAFDRKDC